MFHLKLFHALFVAAAVSLLVFFIKPTHVDRDLGCRLGPHSPPLPTSFPSVRYCRVLNRSIRKIIQGDLAMISNGNIDWQRLIGDGEQVGKRIEEEADRAKQDKRRFLEQQSFGP